MKLITVFIALKFEHAHELLCGWLSDLIHILIVSVRV